MATDDAADQTRSGRRPRSEPEEEDEIEEGEFVAGSDTDDDDDDSPYVLQHRRDGAHDHEEGRPEIIKRRRLEDILLDGGALPSPTPSCECDSDGTISDIDAEDAAGAAALAQEMTFRCPVCRRGFRSEKARCGHMRTHGRQQGHKERPLVVPAITTGWAVTGKRGSVGGSRSVSPESEGVADSTSMAVVVAQPVIDPMPIAFATRSSSAEPNPPNDDSMAIVVAAINPPNYAVVHPPRSQQFHEGHLQPAAPQVTVANTQPAVAQGQLAAASPQILQPAARQVQRAAPPVRDEQGWWLCKEEGCNQRYATHQGLGGHMAGHKNRQNSEAAAAGLHLGIGDAACKPAKLHHCKHCPKVFTSGVQLGGHMRKHYDGKVIPKKRGAVARPNVSAGELASALALSLPMPPAVASVAEVAPAVPGVLRIFGVNIVPAPPAAAAAAAVEEVASAPAAAATVEEVSSAPAAAAAAATVEEVSSAPAAAAGVNIVPTPAPPAAAAAEEVSSAVTETDQSSAASTNNVQQ